MVLNFVPPSSSSTRRVTSNWVVSRFGVKCRAVDTPKRDGLETIMDSSNQQPHILPSSSLIPSLNTAVNYLVLTPEFIRGHLEELIFLKAATRYMRAKHVQYSLLQFNDSENSNIHHHWQIVDSFKAQISQRSRERLLLFDSSLRLGIGAYADALSAVAVIDELHAIQEWEETVVKQEQSAESLSEMKISPPSMPSFYITSFLLQACEEFHRVGGHFLDRIILQNFASKLLEKVTSIYEKLLSSEGDFVTRVSKRGALQIILDLRFCADILSVGREPIYRVISDLAHGLDPLTYEPCVRAATDHSSAFRCLLFGQAVKLDTSSGCSAIC